MPGKAPSKRTRLKRAPARGHFDRPTIDAILDAGVVCHVGYVDDGQPFVTPTLYWREGDRVYWHGSVKSRMIRRQAEGVPVCLTVSHLDGLVLARSGFHHSVNYRSVMLFGAAREVTDPAEKEAALKAFMDGLFPGRWETLRPITRNEVKITGVLWMPIDEASAKIRTGAPVDDEPDYALPIWAGVLPITAKVGKPEPCPRLAPGVKPPAGLKSFKLG